MSSKNQVSNYVGGGRDLRVVGSNQP